MSESYTDFFILDYRTGRIISPLSAKEVCVTAKVLMKISDAPSFDVCQYTGGGKVFVTSHFVERDGTWKHEPPPMVEYAAKSSD